MASIKAKLSSVELYTSQCGDDYSTILNIANDVLSRAEKLYIIVQEELEKISRQVNRVQRSYDEIEHKVNSYMQRMEDAADEIDRCSEEIDYIYNHPSTVTTTDEEGNETTEEVIDYDGIRAAERERDAARSTYNLYENKCDEARMVFREAGYTVSKFQNTKYGIEAVSRSIQNDIYEIKKYIRAIEDEAEFNIHSLQGVIDSLQSYLASKAIFMPEGSYYEEFASPGKGNGGTDFQRRGGGNIFANIFKKDKNINKALKGVEHRPIELASAERTEQQIISSISGGDMTEGSCSSLALAYAGNKAGYVVFDFRDGKSRQVFSSRSSIEQIASLEGVDSVVLHGTDDTICAEQLMTRMKPGKEYYMATGAHAAVVRLSSEGRYQYLELQSGIPSENGWQSLTLNTLYSRFGCEDGQDAEYSNYLIELSSLQSNTEFLNLLGYINTAESAQVKGASGYVR